MTPAAARLPLVLPERNRSIQLRCRGPVCQGELSPGVHCKSVVTGRR
jgi:hypothetical protein